jgi:hypothetical protein
MARPKMFDEETVVVSVRLPISLRDRLAQLAQSEKRSMNQEILLLIERGLIGLDVPSNTAPPRAAARGRSKHS